MKGKNQLPYSTDMTEYEQVPPEDFSLEVEKVTQKCGNTWLQFTTAASGN